MLMSDESDKRRARRVQYPCEVRFQGATTLLARLSDLSSTGAFIDSTTQLPAGVRVTLRFALPSGPILIDADVVHSMPNFGMGVNFVDLTREQFDALEQFIHQQS
jgi:hypothetical protein